jgi:hypothetical protein
MVLSFSVFVARADEPGGIILRRSDDGARQDLVKTLEKLRVQLDIEGQVLGVLEQNNDGSALTLSKINLVTLMLERDKAVTVSTAETAIEDLRWCLTKALLSKKQLAARRRLELANTERDIQQLADVIAKKDALLVGSTDQEDLEVERKKAELCELIRTRSSREDVVNRYKNEIAAHTAEMTTLSSLGKHLDQISRLAERRVERALDGAEEDPGPDVDLTAARKHLLAVTELLKTQPSTHALPPTPVQDTPGIVKSVQRLMLVDRADATAGTSPTGQEELKAVEEEIKKARLRLQSKNNAATLK